MTTELEQEFFKAFGIEPIDCFNQDCIQFDERFKKCDMSLCAYSKDNYPTITDGQYISLFCIAINLCNHFEFRGYLDTEGFKKLTLDLLIDSKRDKINCKHQIQQLFKEGE